MELVYAAHKKHDQTACRLNTKTICLGPGRESSQNENEGAITVKFNVNRLLFDKTVDTISTLAISETLNFKFATTRCLSEALKSNLLFSLKVPGRSAL